MPFAIAAGSHACDEAARFMLLPWLLFLPIADEAARFMLLPWLLFLLIAGEAP
jgi:hypothetical protein